MMLQTKRNKKLDIEEINIDNPPIRKTKLKIAILYPNSYFLGMSNLGFQGLFYFFLKYGDFHINRFFYDEDNSRKVYSPDNHFSLNQANMIFVSNSFEIDFVNLIELLIKSGIEPLAKDRKNTFLGVGGAFPNINPNIFLDIADIIFTGDFEDYIEELLYNCSLWQNYKTKDLFLSSFSNIDKYTIYKDKPLTNSEIEYNLPKSKALLLKPNYSHILTKSTSFSNTFLVEITRGCRFKCHFCTVPSLYGNLRSFPKDTLFELIDLGLSRTKKIGLVSALTTDHKDLVEIVSYIHKNGGHTGFSSLRIENITDELLYLIRESKQNTLTIAPEVISKVLKQKIKKPIKKDTILSLSEKAIKLGFKSIKLYFLIGFVEEDESALREIVSFVLEIRKIALSFAKDLKYMPKIIVSANQFIPKPRTPLACDELIDKKSIKKKISFLRKNLIPFGNIQVRSTSYNESYLQWRLDFANSDLGCILVDRIKKGYDKNKLFVF